MSELLNFGTALSAAPGLVALIGAAVGYGKLVQRLQTVEQSVEKLSNLGEQVTRIDERTLNIKADVGDMKTSVDRLVSIALNEPNRFGPPPRRRDAPT